MDLRVLRYFLAVVREESITAAAEVLHITQPTLSRQLMDLEHEVGTQLLIRGGRGQPVTLTDKGMLLRRRAEELVELADKTQLELSGTTETIAGDITIGGGETDAMRLIARTIKGLQREYPGMRYRFYSGNAEDVKERLDKGLVDFGVFLEPADMQKYEKLRLPAVDTWGLLMRKDHPLAKQPSVTPEEVRQLPLLIPCRRMVDEQLSQWLDVDVRTLNVVATYNLTYNASIMVGEGVGCMLGIDKIINTTGSSNLQFVPLEPPMVVNLDIAWKKYQIFTPAAEMFLNRLRADWQRIE